MKLFKKMAVNFHSQVEAVANQFENKEALSSSYIREYERIVASAKVRLARVEAEAIRLEKESDRLTAQATLWAERARRVHAADENQALECVRRVKRVREQHSAVVQELEEIRALKRRMTHDVDRAGQKLADLKHRHQVLAGRQSCAEAMDGLPSSEKSRPEDLDALYTRWETEVTARELHTHSLAPETDRLAAAFDREEEEADLRLTLEEIITTPEENKE